MKMHIDAAYRSINKNNEERCGDKVQIVRTDNSTIAVLADGLGSGVKANILSTLTSTIIATMLQEGASVVEAVETIASTLQAGVLHLFHRPGVRRRPGGPGGI